MNDMYEAVYDDRCDDEDALVPHSDAEEERDQNSDADEARIHCYYLLVVEGDVS